MMRQWVSLVAVILVLAGVAAAAGWTFTKGEAETLPCANQDGASLAAETDAPNTFESLVLYDGTANGNGDSHSVRFCGEDTMYMQIVVTWKGNKDLRLTVTDPETGDTHVIDNQSGTSYEWFAQAGPLSHGDWQVTVSNNGKGNVAYHAVVQFQ